jgi:exonuclease VII small subunit
MNEAVERMKKKMKEKPYLFEDDEINLLQYVERLEAHIVNLEEDIRRYQLDK